jgi:hypothetical protein
LFEREVLQRKADLVAALREEVFLGDALRRVFARDGLEVRRSRLPGSESLFPADRVHAAVVHEREEEGSERTPGGVERLRRSPDREERVMDDVLRQGLLSREPEGEPVRDRGISLVELVEGRPVARGKPPMELEILAIALPHAAAVSQPACRRRADADTGGVREAGRDGEGGSSERRRPRVVLYARSGCHLCDVARDVVLQVRTGVDFEFEEVDVALDDALELEYGIRIPVVAVDGEERFEVTVDAGELAGLLRASRGDVRS